MTNEFQSWFKLLKQQDFKKDLSLYTDFQSEEHLCSNPPTLVGGSLVNLFRCVKYHPEAIVEEMSLLLNSREIFNCFKNQDTEGMTDIHKAARYFYLIKASYGCKVDTFGSRPRKISKLDNLLEIKERLESGVIENKSFDALINQYDRDKALFYCDPPYFEAESFYDTGDYKFDESQHIRLKDILSRINGKAVISYNDCEFVRDLYRDFNIEEIERQNNLASRHGTGKVYKELIIRNY